MLSGKMKASIILFCITLAIILIGAGVFLYAICDVAKRIKEAEAAGESTAEGLSYVMIALFLASWGIIICVACTILNIISYILQKTAKNDKPHKAWSVITFISIFLPAITEVLLLFSIQWVQ